MKVIFLGSNPSNASPINDPFTHCKSRSILDAWIPKLGLTYGQVEFKNVSNAKTPGNRPLKSHEINAALPALGPELDGRVVVALGKAAQRAIELLVKMPNGYKPKVTVALPHPSGLNRQLNQREWVDQCLDMAKEKISQFIDLPHRS